MLTVKESVKTHGENVICTVTTKRIRERILFIGFIEAHVGVLCVGEILKIEFRWNIETDFLLKKMEQALSPFDVLNLIDSIRKYELYT